MLIRHKKRGTVYQLKGEAEVQISKPDKVDGWNLMRHGMNGRLLFEGMRLAVYRDPITGKLWARFPDEMSDGRFEEIGNDGVGQPDSPAEGGAAAAGSDSSVIPFRSRVDEDDGSGPEAA